jgi:hypothetical protein
MSETTEAGMAMEIFLPCKSVPHMGLAEVDITSFCLKAKSTIRNLQYNKTERNRIAENSLFGQS